MWLISIKQEFRENALLESFEKKRIGNLFSNLSVSNFTQKFF